MNSKVHPVLQKARVRLNVLTTRLQKPTQLHEKEGCFRVFGTESPIAMFSAWPIFGGERGKEGEQTPEKSTNLKKQIS